MDHLDLTICKKSRRTEFVPCAFSGKTFGKESVLTTPGLKKHVALLLGRMNIDSVEDRNNNSAYNTQYASEDASFREQVEGNTLSPTIDDDTDRKRRVQNAALVS